MIKSDINGVTIEGSNLSLMIELCSIFVIIRENSPELLAGVIAGWSDKLQEDIPNLDEEIFTLAAQFTLKCIKAYGVSDEK